jgi:hypothetical protein
VSPVCCSCTEHGKARSDTAVRHVSYGVGAGERESAVRGETGGVEYRCGLCWRTGS